MRILTNHVGYELRGPKRAVLQGRGGEQAETFAVCRQADAPRVFAGRAVPVGPVHRWKDWHFWLADFAVDTEGTYYLECRADDGDRPFFHPSDAGLPVIAPLTYAEIAEAAEQAGLLDAVQRALRFELRLTGEVANPFGYARQYVQDHSGARRTCFFFPHDTETAPWWQGENARLGSLAAAARLAAARFRGDPSLSMALEIYAWDQLSWILGRNPYDSCMLHGSGHDNPEYLFFASYEYANAPGGICNGITAGLEDEEGIDFNLRGIDTGVDNDWRWTEQWIPHAAWYLLAVALGTSGRTA